MTEEDKERLRKQNETLTAFLVSLGIKSCIILYPDFQSQTSQSLTTMSLIDTKKILDKASASMSEMN